MRVAWCRLIRRTVVVSLLGIAIFLYLQLCQHEENIPHGFEILERQVQQASGILQAAHLKALNDTGRNIEHNVIQNPRTLSETSLIILRNTTPPDEYSFRRNDFYVPSKCPTSVQKKLQANQWTSELFHPEIIQLLTSTGISKAEYQRLLKYWMPFGFKYHQNFTYEELVGVLGLFPNKDSIFDFTRHKTRPQCVSCAVIGNGGILNGSRKGKEIDDHDMVFRVNHCIRRGYEEDVGNRTTHLVLMDRSLSHTKSQDIPRDQGIKYVFLPCRKKDYRYITDIVTSNSTRLKLRISPSDVRILHPDFTRYVHKIWENTKSFRPTTGGMMFFTALHAGCDHISVYGMGFTKSYSEHYYDKVFTKYKNVKGSHDFNKEIQILKRLDQDGIVQWYKRDVQEFIDRWSQPVHTTISPPVDKSKQSIHTRSPALINGKPKSRRNMTKTASRQSVLRDRFGQSPHQSGLNSSDLVNLRLKAGLSSFKSQRSM